MTRQVSGAERERRSEGSVLLDRGRACCARQRWADAFRALSRADRAAPLAPDDLELFATSAWVTGRDEEHLRTLQRAHQAHLAAGDRRRAARCAFWLGFRLLMRGEAGRATGWLGRAQRTVEGEAADCAERGYLLLPAVEQDIAAGDPEAAYGSAARAVEIGERCGDRDLVACARHQQGRIRIAAGQVEEGLALLDEVMVTATAGELSPPVTGLVYCSVIQACQAVYALGRAREWTAALARWCEAEMDAFTGICRVHRAEVLELRGDWQGASEEARRARARPRGTSPATEAAAFYRQAEVHRLRGELGAAEQAYRSASRGGYDPQPGLALLRLAEGNLDAAAAAVGRALAATTDRLAARGSCRPGSRSCWRPATGRWRRKPAPSSRRRRRPSTPTRSAPWRHTRAAPSSSPTARPTRRSRRCAGRSSSGRRPRPPTTRRGRASSPGWRAGPSGTPMAPRSSSRPRRPPIARLGAAPDLARLASAGTPDRHGLSKRELEVLRLVAAGDTNKAIAATLFLSERTVERHLSNIFTKLDLTTRAAATSWAWRHGLA